MKKLRSLRILSSMVLMGALAAPVGLQAQDRDEHKDRDDRANQRVDEHKDRDDRANQRVDEHKDRDDRAREHRVYDRQHKDYHNWNDDEDRNYRQWYTQKYNGREYREYDRLGKRDQTAYWDWRHQHGDNDDHHDNDHHDRDHR